MDKNIGKKGQARESFGEFICVVIVISDQFFVHSDIMDAVERCTLLKMYLIDYAITVVPFFLTFIHLCPAPLLPPAFPALPPVLFHVHGSYIEVLGLLHFLYYS